MIRKTLNIAVVLFFTGELIAGGFQIGIGGGYGFASGRQYVGSSYDNSTPTADEYKDVLASYGNGIKMDLDATIFFNDNIGIMIASGFSMLGGYELERKNPTVTLKEKRKASYLPITFGLKIKAGNKNLLPYLYIAPGIFIPIGTNGEDILEFSNSRGEKDEITAKFATGFGVSSGLGALLNISDNFGIKVECSPTYAFARLKEVTTKYYNGAKATTVYKKDKHDLPADDISNPNDVTYYEHGAHMFSFSSIAAKIGIVITIGN